MTSFIFTQIIDPLTKGMRALVLNQCGTDQRIIDLGCGPGTLAIEMAENNHVLGLDLSKEVIDFAIKKAKNLGLEEKTTFLCENIDNIDQFGENEFDILVMSLFLHQFTQKEQLKIFSDASRIAKKLIIADYSIPVPGGFTGLAIRMAEFLAGGEHHKNFKSNSKQGGCLTIANQLHLNLLHTETTFSGAFSVWVFE